MVGQLLDPERITFDATQLTVTFLRDLEVLVGELDLANDALLEGGGRVDTGPQVVRRTRTGDPVMNGSRKPCSGIETPMPSSGSAKVASSETTRWSQHIAMMNPAPIAAPLTAPTTGRGLQRTDSKSARSRSSVSRSSSAQKVDILSISLPAQNALKGRPVIRSRARPRR